MLLVEGVEINLGDTLWRKRKSCKFESEFRICLNLTNI